MYLDGVSHVEESISYMIVEEGAHELADGTWIEAGSATARKKWKTIKYEHKFKKSPGIFTQIVSQKKLKPYVLR